MHDRSGNGVGARDSAKELANQYTNAYCATNRCNVSNATGGRSMNWDNFAIAVKALSVCALALFAIVVAMLSLVESLKWFGLALVCVVFVATVAVICTVFYGIFCDWRNKRANSNQAVL